MMLFRCLIIGVLYKTTISLDCKSPCNSWRGLLSARPSHSGKYLAVSPELNRFVTVRNSRITACGRYPLPCYTLRCECPEFPLSLAGRAVIWTPGALCKNRTCVARASNECITIMLTKRCKYGESNSIFILGKDTYFQHTLFAYSHEESNLNLTDRSGQFCPLNYRNVATFLEMAVAAIDFGPRERKGPGMHCWNRTSDNTGISCVPCRLAKCMYEMRESNSRRKFGKLSSCH